MPQSQPVQPVQPVLSVIIAAVPARELETMLSTLFAAQEQLPDFEVLLLDDASSDGAWEVAQQYLGRYPSIITVSRTYCAIGKELSYKKALMTYRGKYVLDLASVFERGAFNPKSIAEEVAALQNNPPARTSQFANGLPPLEIARPPGSPFEPSPFFFSLPPLPPPAANPETPLVSIILYNYNYGRYLDQCLESAFAQTWPNLEVCFSDNASDDDSWAIALKWAKKYPDRMHLTRNRINYGAGDNWWNGLRHVRGKYVITLCSDDALRPDYLRRCVETLETHPSAAFVVVHRDIIDEHGNITKEPPFYDQSCLIPGSAQAAVYMMTPLVPCISQVLYRASEYWKVVGVSGSQWWDAWMRDFVLCARNDMCYIKEALLLHRVHSASDGASIDANLIQGFGQYVMALRFAQIANDCMMPPEVPARLPAAIAKLGRLCLRYALRFLLKDEESIARRYFHLAQAIDLDITHNPTFLQLEHYWQANTAERSTILSELRAMPNQESRAISYVPPPSFQTL
jgi:glycosyltransferase involved in cell wall biosynthesis